MFVLLPKKLEEMMKMLHEMKQMMRCLNCLADLWLRVGLCLKDFGETPKISGKGMSNTF